MAIFKKISDQGKYQDDHAIPDLITYITRKDKTPSNFIGGVETDENDIAGSMMRVSNAFNKNSYIRLRLLGCGTSFQYEWTEWHRIAIADRQYSGQWKESPEAQLLLKQNHIGST